MIPAVASTRRRFLSGLAAGAAGAAAWRWPGERASAQVAAAPASPAGLPQFRGFTPGLEGEAFWADVRHHFSLDPQLTFLNNGTLGPAPDFVVDTREHYSRLLAADPRDNFRSKELAEVRAELAAFINASPDETSITHSTTEGMNIFAHGLDWKAGDEVILGDQEHFGATEPYRTLAQRCGIKVVTAVLPMPAAGVSQIVDAYAKAFTPRTRVLVVSTVSWLTGMVAPLGELAKLAHDRGALISVDGAQSFGVLPLDVQAAGIDHFAGSGQKWLLAGTGTGVNYVRRSVQPTIWPLYGFHDPASATSARYERSGQLGIPAAAGIGAALQFQSAIGTPRIEARSRELGARLRAGLARIPGATLLTPADPLLSGNLQVFTLPGLPSPGVVRLLEQQERIVVRGVTIGETRAVRVSTHVYNTPQQVDRLLDVLHAWVKKPPVFPPEPKRGG
jgi:selenocysteine lyase/cysteine desulfurase